MWPSSCITTAARSQPSVRSTLMRASPAGRPTSAPPQTAGPVHSRGWIHVRPAGTIWIHPGSRSRETARRRGPLSGRARGSPGERPILQADPVEDHGEADADGEPDQRPPGLPLGPLQLLQGETIAEECSDRVPEGGLLLSDPGDSSVIVLPTASTASMVSRERPGNLPLDRPGAPRSSGCDRRGRSPRARFPSSANRRPSTAFGRPPAVHPDCRSAALRLAVSWAPSFGVRCDLWYDALTLQILRSRRCLNPRPKEAREKAHRHPVAAQTEEGTPPQRSRCLVAEDGEQGRS